MKLKDTNHLFFYGNVHHPTQVFLAVPAEDIFQIAELSIVKGSEIPEHIAFLCFGFQANPEYAELNDYISEVRKMKQFHTIDDGSIKSHMQLLCH